MGFQGVASVVADELLLCHLAIHLDRGVVRIRVQHNHLMRILGYLSRANGAYLVLDLFLRSLRLIMKKKKRFWFLGMST